MPTYIALLRGVNVGKAKRIAMADLRALLEKLGTTDVSTLLNSGNAVFSAPGRSAGKLAGDIAAALSAKLKLEVPVIVKPAAELDAIVRENPLARKAENPSQLLVAFAQEASALRGLRAIVPLVGPREQLVIGKRAAYFHCPDGSLASKAGEALLGKAGKGVTTRNWATVLKLQALAARRAG